MKKSNLYRTISMITLMVVFYSCSKSDDTTTAVVNAVLKSTITFDGKKDNVVVTSDTASGYTVSAVSATDTTTCTINFDSKPKADGTYIYTAVFFSGGNNCKVVVLKNSVIYYSDASDKVTMKISKGKATLTFTDVGLFDGATHKKVSGTLYVD